MLTAQFYAPGAKAAEDIPTEQIDERLKQKDGVVWLDLKEPTDEDFQMLEAEFGFHPLAMEDLKERDQRPKVVEYENYVFVVIHEWHPAEGREDLNKACVERSAEVNAFVGRNFIVTVHTGDSPALKTTRKRWETNQDLQRQGPYYLLYLLLDSVVDDYYPTLDAYDDRIDTLEEMVLKPADQSEHIFRRFGRDPSEGDPSDPNRPRPLTTLLGLRRDMLEMRRYVAPLRDAVNVLLRHVESIGEDANTEAQRRDRAHALFAYYQDIYDHTIRVVDTIDTYRDLLSGTLDAHLAVASNRLNEIVKVMTSVSIILMTWATVCGIYGMNFTDMPELHWHYGYPYALGLMAVLGGLEWVYFRRRRWL